IASIRGCGGRIVVGEIKGFVTAKFQCIFAFEFAHLSYTTQKTTPPRPNSTQGGRARRLQLKHASQRAQQAQGLKTTAESYSQCQPVAFQVSQEIQGSREPRTPPAPRSLQEQLSSRNQLLVAPLKLPVPPVPPASPRNLSRRDRAHLRQLAHRLPPAPQLLLPRSWGCPRNGNARRHQVQR